MPIINNQHGYIPSSPTKTYIMRTKVLLEIQSFTKMPIEGKEVWEVTAARSCTLEVKSTCAR